MRNAALCIALTLVLPGRAAYAQTDPKFLLMARNSWAAFECHALALELEEKEEAKRLFELGYKQGKTFLTALQSGQITREDAESRIPWGIVTSLDGPNQDFIVGRYSGFAYHNALKTLPELEVGPKARVTRAGAAMDKFQMRNCRILR